MSIVDGIEDTSLAAESIPVVIALALAITKVVEAKTDSAAQLDALQTAAEAVKRRMDQIKFPNESEA